MSDITLSAGVRQNLLTLQSTADMMATTQNRLATGKKVNSALDNPTNFFTSQSLSARAKDLTTLLDGIGNQVFGPVVKASSYDGRGDVTLRIASPLVNNSVEIRYTIARPSTPVRVSIFGVTGSRIRELKHAVGDPGAYVVTWDTFDEYSRRVPRGVYLVELRAGDAQLSRKIVLARP